MDAEAYDQWYETAHGRWTGEREMALILEALEPRAGESLLDVGCGTGYFTRALALVIGGPVTGVDISAEWLAYARSRTGGNITYDVGDARELSYADRSFDLVVSIAALSFVKEEHLAISEMHRVARRRIAIGLLNRHSLLWLRKGKRGGEGGYQGARWHTAKEAVGLFDGLPVQKIRVRTGLHFVRGGRFARFLERIWPRWLHTGAFILVVADVA